MTAAFTGWRVLPLGVAQIVNLIDDLLRPVEIFSAAQERPVGGRTIGNVTSQKPAAWADSEDRVHDLDATV
jgi:hypothetical protein